MCIICETYIDILRKCENYKGSLETYLRSKYYRENGTLD